MAAATNKCLNRGRSTYHVLVFIEMQRALYLHTDLSQNFIYKLRLQQIHHLPCSTILCEIYFFIKRHTTMPIKLCIIKYITCDYMISEFKEGHLYDKFLTSLKCLLGTKPTSTEELPPRGTTPSLFSPEVERQMKDKGIYDSFLQINFESLMTVNDDTHTLLDDKFTRFVCFPTFSWLIARLIVRPRGCLFFFSICRFGHSFSSVV